MKFKDYFVRKVIPAYFMIVTFIVIGMGIATVAFYGMIEISVLTLFVPPVFGALGCLPLLLDYFFLKIKSSGRTLLLYNLAEWLILEVCILTAAYFLHMIDSLLTAGIIAAMVLAIFAAVGAVMYRQDRRFCDTLNAALAQYKEKSRK